MPTIVCGSWLFELNLNPILFGVSDVTYFISSKARGRGAGGGGILFRGNIPLGENIGYKSMKIEKITFKSIKL